MPSVPRCWPGDTVAIFATGPSLVVDDIARVRARGLRVIAINDAITLAPWADVLYSSDARWWRRYQGVPNFRGPKYCIGQSRGRADALFADIVVLTHTGVDGLERDPSGLRSGEHSGYAAINLAVHLGATRVLLLGYDLDGAHFFGAHPVGLHNTTAPEFARFRSHYSTLAVELAALDVDVVNCTPRSRVPIFPIRPLVDVLDVEATAWR